MQLKDFLLISGKVDPFEVRPLGVLVQLYWEARQQGRPGLKQEDVDANHVEFLVELFDYDATGGVFVHPATEALLLAATQAGNDTTTTVSSPRDP